MDFGETSIETGWQTLAIDRRSKFFPFPVEDSAHADGDDIQDLLNQYLAGDISYDDYQRLADEALSRSRNEQLVEVEKS